MLTQLEDSEGTKTQLRVRFEVKNPRNDKWEEAILFPTDKIAARDLLVRLNARNGVIESRTITIGKWREENA